MPLYMTKALEELTFLVDFWSGGPREEENVLDHARWNLANTRIDAGLERLERYNIKAKIPDDVKIKFVCHRSINFTVKLKPLF